MKLFGIKTISVTMSMLFSCSAGYAADNARISPHSDSGDCTICHVAPVGKLRGWFVFGSTKREMKSDLNQLCLQCHTVKAAVPGEMGIGIGHATGKTLKTNDQNLPLAQDGTITCATTCHNIHVDSDDRQLHPKLLRLPPNVLCVSCHRM